MTRSRQLVADAHAGLASKNLRAASESAVAARDKSPDNDEAWVVLAAVELSSGRKANALDALRHAVEINTANTRQLPKDRNFETLFGDPEFQRIVGR